MKLRLARKLQSLKSTEPPQIISNFLRMVSQENPEEIPEWIMVSFLEFTVLLILWGFIYNFCKSLCQTACGHQFQKIPKNPSKLFFATLAKSFYYVNHGSSIIASKVSQIISLMKT